MAKFLLHRPTMLALWVLSAAVGLAVYAYAGYPLLVALLSRVRGRSGGAPALEAWPSVTVTLPAYNEEATIAATIESLLRLDYPRELLEILVVSDASTDRTDEIVRGYASRGVKLLRLPERKGKTTAENRAREHAVGDIIVNTDASVRVPPGSLRPLIAAFGDPEVAVASGRDISVAPTEATGNTVEAGYVGYEMRVRDLETRAGGIIGTSGCFFATRAPVFDAELPGELSWDFAAPLVARERGYRAVSVPEAICHVPRTSSVAHEYRRKVRTIARGMQTLRYKKHLLNPFRYGAFSWMLFSHKVCRWLLPWAAVVAVSALGVLAVSDPWARLALMAVAAVALLGTIGWAARGAGRLPRVVSVCAFFLAGNLAVLHAALRALSNAGTPTWEPTRREGAPAVAAGGKA